MAKEGLKSLFRESTAGRCFQVAFEIKRLLTIGKRKSSFDPPGPVFERVKVLAGIVVFQTLFKVFRESGVKAFRVTQ
jgi:hypothetical protein